MGQPARKTVSSPSDVPLTRSPREHRQTRLPAAASVDVLPIFFLEQVSEHKEHQQKQRHKNAHRLALLLDGLTGVVEKIRDVPNELIILFWLQGARGHCI